MNWKIPKPKDVRVSVGAVSASWEVKGAATPYEVKDEFLIIATIANAAGIDESFQISAPVPRNGRVSDLLQPAKFQRVLNRSIARTGAPPSSFQLDGEADPILFDWNISKLDDDIPLSKIAHGRVVFAVFDPTEMAAEKAAFFTKMSIKDKTEIKTFLDRPPA